MRDERTERSDLWGARRPIVVPERPTGRVRPLSQLPEAPQPARQPKAHRALKEIEFTLPSLPKLDIKKLFSRVMVGIRWVQQRSRRTRIITAALLCLIVIWPALSRTIWPPKKVTISEHPMVTTTSPKGLTKGKPDFATVLPNGGSIDRYGGWTRVSPPDHNPVFAYADQINGVAISVSEQPLPEEFKNDTDDKVSTLAANYNATERVSLPSGMKFYLGSTSKGPQSAILTKNNLLILIKSDGKISTSDWINYLSALR